MLKYIKKDFRVRRSSHLMHSYGAHSDDEVRCAEAFEMWAKSDSTNRGVAMKIRGMFPRPKMLGKSEERNSEFTFMLGFVDLRGTFQFRGENEEKKVRHVASAKHSLYGNLFR